MRTPTPQFLTPSTSPRVNLLHPVSLDSGTPHSLYVAVFLDEELAAIFNALPNNNDTKQAQSHLYFLFNNSISFTSENKYKVGIPIHE